MEKLQTDLDQITKQTKLSIIVFKSSIRLYDSQQQEKQFMCELTILGRLSHYQLLYLHVASSIGPKISQVFQAHLGDFLGEPKVDEFFLFL
ncbi:hypothetical protein CFP56_014512 [Quercus suber]|uniref:Uncharacterized protein n=1 Tax=Quercus suber TaxID=58331 RepID=A0AAW0M3E1_QUESU